MRKRKRRSRESKRESAWSGSTSASPTRSRIGRRIGGIANRPAISRRRSRAATRAGRGGRIPTGGCCVRRESRRGHRRIRPRRHREVLTHGRPGAEHPISSNKLPSFREYSILRACVDREEGSISRAGLDDPSGVGAELGAGERALRRPSTSGRIFLPPTPKAGWSRSRSTSPDSGYASIDLAWPSPPATGALYLADMNSPNSVVKDRSRHRRRGSRRMCVPASHNIS